MVWYDLHSTAAGLTTSSSRTGSATPPSAAASPPPWRPTTGECSNGGADWADRCIYVLHLTSSRDGRVWCRYYLVWCRYYLVWCRYCGTELRCLGAAPTTAVTGTAGQTVCRYSTVQYSAVQYSTDRVQHEQALQDLRPQRRAGVRRHHHRLGGNPRQQQGLLHQ